MKKSAGTGSALDFFPDRKTLAALQRASSKCRGCDLYAKATQTVFGEGSQNAGIMLVGEQPGDNEDRIGKPFVGPAGKLLAKVLDELGIERNDIYVTNVVKHFSYEESGKRRIHKKPNDYEVRACLPWLIAEIRAVEPTVIVCLGATAAQALLGKQFKVTQSRGEVFRTELAPFLLATVHPSSLLRVSPRDEFALAREAFKRDLSIIHSLLQQKAV